MSYRNGIQNYQETRLQTSNPAKLIALLYQRLRDELGSAQEFINAKKYFEKGNAILKCQDIIMELNNSLNLEAGPIAKNLQALYLFMFRELNVINLHNDTEKLEKIIQIVDNLKEAWEIISGSEKNKIEQVPEAKTKMAVVR